MRKYITFLFIGLIALIQLKAQQKKYQPSEVEKVQAIQKGIKPNGKNATVIHPTKSDGTMDMRYKANKEKFKANAPGPRKSDGTPDMRYKENKKAIKTTSAKPTN
ncbi:hypothetical protein [Sediminibacterium sp.]|uniref:hypothetical protein n=1 Tax=Sediminibacterium sp. TaxID=1917865 RepID=UPI003F6EA5E1